VLIPRLLNMSQPFVLAAGIAAVAGHNWPVFLNFRGGRGEATTIGVMAGLIPIPMLIIAVPTILTLLIVKNVITATAVMFVGLPMVDWMLGVSGLMVIYGIGLPVLVALTHYFRVHHQRHAAPTGTA
jgi:glycerol-3-phosphate acyltransferase PlsY